MNRRFIIRDQAIRDRAVAAVASLPFHADRPIEVLLRPYKRNRSLSQNSCLHAWCAAIANAYEEAFGDRISPEAWKEYFKGRFLGEESREVLGRVVTVTRHTSTLSVAEFRDFLDAIDRWAVDNLQLFLPRGYDYAEAMGQDDRSAA